jgi:lipopolysaccharide assembly outer membrane protein LptD (OstA)
MLLEKGVMRFRNKIVFPLLVCCLYSIITLFAVRVADASDGEEYYQNIWSIKPGDILDINGLVKHFKDEKDPVIQKMMPYISSATHNAFANYEAAGVASSLVSAIVVDLNKIIEGPLFYDSNTFASIPLSIKTINMLKEEPTGEMLYRLNRYLLEDIFPNEIKPMYDSIWLFTAVDIQEPVKLIEKWRQAVDPLSQYFIERASDSSRMLIMDYKSGTSPSVALRKAAVSELNKALYEKNLYEKNRFTGVDLSDRTKELLAKLTLTDAEQMELNRLLLQDAYPELARAGELPIKIVADSLEYDNKENLLLADGHIKMVKDEEILLAEHAIINTETMDVMAEGNVYFEQNSDVWMGKKLRYNFASQRGDFGIFDSYLEPFYVKAKTCYRDSDGTFVLSDVTLTTCEGASPVAYFKATKAWIVPGHHVRARHVVMYLNGVPVMYSPVWSQNIGDQNFISMVPGYSSRMYAFLLTTFNYRITRHLEAKSHLDLRTRRGVAVGQDLLWSERGDAKLSTERYMEEDDEEDSLWHFGTAKKQDIEDQDKWFGDIIAYYAQDRWPEEDDDDLKYKIDEERYRIRLSHNQSFDSKNYMLANLNYMSDYKFIEQYFRKEYKADPEPENNIMFSHRADKYSADLLVTKRFNDFFTTVDRLPEGKITFDRQKIADTPFYYQGEHSAAYLEKNWEAASNVEDYSAGRFDTLNMIYYPTRHFDFLNVIPRAGWRFTGYSKTKEDYTNIISTTSINTNGITTTNFTSEVLMDEKGGEVRSLPELGVESSFKAFKVWETHPGMYINNIRHIAEPYVNYTYNPSVNVETNELYQFDDIDTLDDKNELRLGMRNKIQTQRFAMHDSAKRHSIADLIYADFFTVWRIEKNEGENTFSNLAWDVRSYPADWLEIRTDGSYDPYDGSISEFNVRLNYRYEDLFSNELEHRYFRDSNNLLNDTFKITPIINWTFNVFCRYEFEKSDMEAYGISLQRTYDCVAMKIGYEFEDDSHEVWIQFWFTQFPKVRMDVGI